MTDKIYNRYCDKLLKYLNINREKEPLLFATGKFREEKTVTNDVFEKLNIPDENVAFIISNLEGDKLIEVFSKGGGVSKYDHVTNTYISSGTFQIKITDTGSQFIQSTSFSREAKKEFLHKWLPNITTIMTVVISLVSLAVSILSYKNPNDEQVDKIMKDQYLKNKELESRINRKIDSLWKSDTTKHSEKPPFE